MTKELALIFEFDKAPKELQDAARVCRDNSVKFQKLNSEGEALLKELKQSEKDFLESQKKFNLLLNKWEPQDQSLSTK